MSYCKIFCFFKTVVFNQNRIKIISFLFATLFAVIDTVTDSQYGATFCKVVVP